MDNVRGYCVTACMTSLLVQCVVHEDRAIQVLLYHPMMSMCKYAQVCSVPGKVVHRVYPS